MGNSGSRWPASQAARQRTASTSGMSLHTPRGARKYLSRSERQRVMALMLQRQDDADLFGLTLAWTGARVSEILALRREAFDLEAGLVTLQTLKRRRPVVRQVPLPSELLTLLDRRYGLTNGDPDERLWRFSRSTAWRHIRHVMEEVGLRGHAACPRGFRHAFGVGTLQSGVPVTLLQRWLGHARLTTTAIYAEVSGAEEMAFAGRYWRWSDAA